MPSYGNGHRSVFNLYFDDLALRNAVIDAVATFGEAPSLGELAKALRAGAEAAWLVATPITNFAPEEVSVPLADDVLLCRAHPDPKWGRFDSDYAVHDAVRDHFKLPHSHPRLEIQPRWRDAPDPETDGRNREEAT